MGKAEEFETGHQDRVTVLHTNFNGTRILTGSIDHRIKIWDRDVKTGERTLIDTFTAHDSDIRDAKFFHPTTGSHIATIGNDLKFQLWSEDVSQAPNSGRRFRRTATIQSAPRVPFVSLDIKTTDNVYTTLALIDRQGLLSIYEPSNPDDLREWTLIDSFNVCGTNPPGRGEETSFKVRWDQNPTPLAYINSLSDDRSQLSLVVSALNEVKIYRSTIPGSDGMSTSGSGPGTNANANIMGATNASADGASHRLMFYEAARLPRHPALVRDVQWAPFSVRGTDRLATACKDGTVRIFELGVVETPDRNRYAGGSDGASKLNRTHTTTTTSDTTDASLPANVQQQQQRQYQQQQQQQQHQQQSSLTSAITGRATQQQHQLQQGPSSAALSGGPSRSTRTGYIFPFTTTIQSSTSLSSAHSDAWSLAWDGQGQVLMSNGSDGVTKLWRKSILGGQWLVFAGQEVLDRRAGDDDDDDDDEEDEDEGLDGDDAADYNGRVRSRSRSNYIRRDDDGDRDSDL
ncbi:hypothetical protein KCU88_g3636, partial [Aureobasidium melanogenum]